MLFLYFRLCFIFPVINKAWKTLENPETKAKCMDIIEEARAKTDYMVYCQKYLVYAIPRCLYLP